MRRTFERGAKARLSFSDGPHAPVNMADSMENGGSWTVSGSKEAVEVPKNFKDLRKLGAQNIAQYSGANVPFPAFLSTDITSLRLALVPCSHFLCEQNLLTLQGGSARRVK